jgi:hypothetical protein
MNLKCLNKERKIMMELLSDPIFEVTMRVIMPDGETIVNSASRIKLFGFVDIFQNGFRISFNRFEENALDTIAGLEIACIGKFISHISLLKATEIAEDGDKIVEHNYGMSTEFGEIDAISHKVIRDGKTIFDTATKLFEPTAGREKFKSAGFLELLLMYAVVMSDRKTAELLNRVRHDHRTVQATTVANIVKHEGEKAQECIEKNGAEIQMEYKDTVAELGMNVPKPSNNGCNVISIVDKETIELAAANLKLTEYDVNVYESPDESVYGCMDQVLAPEQKENREKRVEGEDRKPAKKKRTHVSTSTAHVHYDGIKHAFVAANLTIVASLILSFMLINGVTYRNLVFFYDGAKNILEALYSIFHFKKITIILDWLHLRDKCKGLLSLGLYNKKSFCSKLLTCLWWGHVDKAIKMLRDIDSKQVKNQDKVNELIGWIERNRPYIPCYIMRKKLGLPNSSNPVEKVNDIVVSKRQKRVGMSWSKRGSRTYATISALIYNNKLKQWINERDISFTSQESRAA